MAGIFDNLHVKRHTAGSSNELSFDVLDLKRDEADARAAKSGKAPKMPKASKGSYHGVTGTATLSGQLEVQQRKAARQSHRLRWRIVIAVLCVAAVGGLLYLGMAHKDSQVEFSQRIEGLVSRLMVVDETLSTADEIMLGTLDEESAAMRAEIKKQIPQLSTELNKISVDAQTLKANGMNERDSLIASQVAESAKARVAMLGVIEEGFDLADEAVVQVDRANSLWNEVLGADQLARVAIAQANKATTPEATQEVLDKTRQALDEFKTVLSELQNLEATYGMDFSAQKAYLSKKIESLELAASTSEALLAGDREAATKANDAYNEADAEAAALAADLPPSIGGIVQSCFEDKIAACQRRYDDARERTVQADANVREYLAQ